MRIALFIFILNTTFFTLASAQNSFHAIVKDKITGEPLPGTSASVLGTTLGAHANEEGLLHIENIPDGEHTIRFSFVGYEKQDTTFTFPLSLSAPITIQLESSGEELEEIVISSTRSSRTIADIPTRVEFIAGEELEEKANMKPGDIRMLLSESTGIQTQQTSATSANASIRIQGLDGRYTQILKDGLPLYAGFSGGLGLLQTPPLDLKQVEVIKGSSSTLYGGGAIAGMVNLISKRPTDERDLRFWANGTSAKGLDLNGYYGETYGKAGLTLFVSRNSNESYDPSTTGLSAIPEFERYTIIPKVFLTFNETNQLDVGFNFIQENRLGGDMQYIAGEGNASHSYFEENDSRRFSTQLSYTHTFNKNTTLNIKNSVNHFKRILKTPGYEFNGLQTGTFTELNFISSREKNEWIAGANIWTDNFSEEQLTTTPLRDYAQTTFGVFAQRTGNLTEQLILEAGLRGDYVFDYGFALLPRISLLFKPNAALSSRIGGGLGYKAPTIFTEESERIQYKNLLPVSAETNSLERSYGVNWDINYKTTLADGAIGLSINQLFFYTRLNDPLYMTTLSSGEFQLVNLDAHMDSKGIETNIKVEFNEFKLLIGYTYTDAYIHDDATTRQNPLTARHRLNNVLMYEVEESWKIGLEAYYFSKQLLSDNTTGKPYWICGFMVEKLWEHLSLYINFENFLDARQTRFDTIYTGPITDPTFRDIYAPVDGFVINGGIKIFL